MTIQYDPTTNLFTITAESVWENRNYNDARMLLRGFNLNSKQIRSLLERAMILGAIGVPLVIT